MNRRNLLRAAATIPVASVFATTDAAACSLIPRYGDGEIALIKTLFRHWFAREEDAFRALFHEGVDSAMKLYNTHFRNYPLKPEVNFVVTTPAGAVAHVVAGYHSAETGLSCDLYPKYDQYLFQVKLAERMPKFTELSLIGQSPNSPYAGAVTWQAETA